MFDAWILVETFYLRVQGIIFLVSHRNLLCIFYMTAIQNIFYVAVFFHRSVQNFNWNIYPSAEIANQIWGGKLFPGVQLKLFDMTSSWSFSVNFRNSSLVDAEPTLTHMVLARLVHEGKVWTDTSHHELYQSLRPYNCCILGSYSFPHSFTHTFIHSFIY